MQRTLNKTAKRLRAREVAMGAIVLLVVAASAWGVGAVVHDSPARASARLEATGTLPACRGSWLRLSISRVSRTSVSPTGRDTSRRTLDKITVTSSQPCTLTGWPVLEQVQHINQATGARPRYTTIKVGHANVVTLGPGRAAVAFATVTVPKGWIWSGGNTCATFPSAFVKLPGVRHAFLVEDLPSTIVSCGGPANEPFRVTVGPFTTARDAGRSLIPVPFGNVEISVPGMWWVELPGSGSCSGPPPTPSGELFLGDARLVAGCGGPVPANVADLFYIKQVPRKYAPWASHLGARREGDRRAFRQELADLVPARCSRGAPGEGTARRQTGPDVAVLSPPRRAEERWGLAGEPTVRHRRLAPGELGRSLGPCAPVLERRPHRRLELPGMRDR